MLSLGTNIFMTCHYPDDFELTGNSFVHTVLCFNPKRSAVAMKNPLNNPDFQVWIKIDILKKKETKTKRP